MPGLVKFIKADLCVKMFEREKSKRRLRIAIATSGRFHVLDLAREMSDLGHDVKFYSMLPDSRVKKFGLKVNCNCSLFPFVFPFAALQKYYPNFHSGIRDHLLSETLDRMVNKFLEPCDVFIGMSGIFVQSLHRARDFGAKIWLERGSRHILSQAEILKHIHGKEPTAQMIERERLGYEIADRIVVPSRHVAESFACDSCSYSKLFLNPYGTDLSMFPYRDHGYEDGAPLRLLYVGNWSLRKGCDLLIKVIKGTGGVRLTHVGSIGDMPFPFLDNRFEHYDAVEQYKLAPFYHNAHAFILASREEGLSVVLAQALASGLPVICTNRTGGDDLCHTASLRERVITVAHDDLESLNNAVVSLRERLRHRLGYLSLSGDDLGTLTWRAYALRYENELLAKSKW